MSKCLVIAFLLAVLMVFEIKAQQDSQYTQYMYNTISINPAYAGSRGVMSIVGLHRSQWVGLPGAPRTQTLGIHTPIGEKNRVGIGFSVVNDEIGPTDETYINADFSYTLPTSKHGRLKFGIKGGLHLLNIDLMGLSKFNQNDALLERNIDNKMSPLVGLGVYYHNQRFYMGVSAPNILETNHFDTNATSSNSNAQSVLAEERINFYLISGYVFDLSDMLKFKPAVLSKLVFGSPLQVDVSANFLYNDRFVLGAAYRWSASVSGMAGFHISDALLIGIAYDRESTQLGNTNFNNGSYELMLRFEFIRKYKRLLTPRFF